MCPSPIAPPTSWIRRTVFRKGRCRYISSAKKSTTRDKVFFTPGQTLLSRLQSDNRGLTATTSCANYGQTITSYVHRTAQQHRTYLPIQHNNNSGNRVVSRLQLPAAPVLVPRVSQYPTQRTSPTSRRHSLPPFAREPVPKADHLEVRSVWCCTRCVPTLTKTRRPIAHQR